MGKRKADKDRKSVPVVVRLSKAEYELVEKRASTLGMNVSTFLRLLIRKGRIELDEGGEHTL
jgi:predicted DNA binding CopG/RHH family protein